MILEVLLYAMTTGVGCWAGVKMEARAARKQRAHEASLLTDDDDVRAYLEASEPSSPLARKLLRDIREESRPALPAPKPAKVPQYIHGGNTPKEVRFKILLEDMDLESNDYYRALTLKSWAERKCDFTATEIGVLTRRFTTPRGRAVARQIMNTARLGEKTALLSTFYDDMVKLEQESRERPSPPEPTSIPGSGTPILTTGSLEPR